MLDKQLAAIMQQATARFLQYLRAERNASALAGQDRPVDCATSRTASRSDAGSIAARMNAARFRSIARRHMAWLWLAGLSAVLLACMALGVVERLGRFGFCGVFALAVTASVQLVGVHLVFSSLISPALATRSLHGRRRGVVA